MKRLLVFFAFCSSALFVNGQKRASVLTPDSLLKLAKQQYNTGNYEKSQEYYLDVIKSVDETKNLKLLIAAHNGVAYSLYRFFDRKGALIWLKKSMQLIEKYRIDSLKDDIYYNISVMYVEIGQIDSAEKYNAKAVHNWKKEKNYSRLSQAQSVMADLYLNAGKDYKKAEKYIIEAEKNAELSGDKNCIAFAAMKRYFLLANDKQDYRSGLAYLNKAEKLYTELGDVQGINYAINFKAICLAKLRDTAAAGYIKRWFYYKDSVFRKERAASVSKYETLYKVSQKEKETQLLNEQAKNQRLVIVLLVISLLGFLALYQLMFWRKKQHITLLELKSLRKDKEILDNINKEKERISRDLHDNVGAQLSFLITNVDWMIKHPELLNDKEGFQNRLKALNETGKSAAYTLRETIWAISHQFFTAEDLADRFKQYVLRIMEFNDKIAIKFIEHIDKKLELSPVSALNLFRICQEAFHNALYHSNCTKIIISFNNNNEKLCCSVEDNGQGFDTSKQVKGHYGLINMQGRTKEIGATLNIVSQIDIGTKVTVKLINSTKKTN